MTIPYTYTDAPGSFKGSLLADELLAALGWPPVTTEGTPRLTCGPDGSQVTIFADDDTPLNSINAVVLAHDPAGLSVSEQLEAIREDVILRLETSVFAGMAPAEIYIAAQNKIDGWATLAQAKADLREYLPLLFAAVMWLVKRRD